MSDAVKKAIRKIKAFLCRRFPRYKLHCIIKTLGLETRHWQIEYALGQSEYMPRGRRTGKTFAVMLRILMLNQKYIQDLTRYTTMDPDYNAIPQHSRKRAYTFWYVECYERCIKAGIPVPMLLPQNCRGVKP